MRTTWENTATMKMARIRISTSMYKVRAVPSPITRMNKIMKKKNVCPGLVTRPGPQHRNECEGCRAIPVHPASAPIQTAKAMHEVARGSRRGPTKVYTATGAPLELLVLP